MLFRSHPPMLDAWAYLHFAALTPSVPDEDKVSFNAKEHFQPNFKPDFTAADIKAAQDKVYAIIDKLDTKGMFYRHDIGFKALNA